METLERIAAVIDRISIWSGKIVAWLIFPMFLVLFYEVLVRKFWYPTIWANDLEPEQWMADPAHSATSLARSPTVTVRRSCGGTHSARSIVIAPRERS